METNYIAEGDCIAHLQSLPAESVDLAFADPPYNIGYEYDMYDDRRSCDEYLEWCQSWTNEVARALKPDGTFWLAIGDEYAAELKVMLTRQRDDPLFLRSWVVWYYTFGVNCTNKFTRSHTHLLYFVKDPKEFTFNSEDPAVRVPSARQLVYRDKRANPKGRLPDDTWITPPETNGDAPLTHEGWFLRPQDVPDGFPANGDTWYYPRVAGTHKERAGEHGCQMPERLLGRIIQSCSTEGDVVMDPFSGTGTTLAVAKKLGRGWIGYDISPNYLAISQKRLAEINVGDELSGAEDPLTSVPKSKNGRRLKK